MKQPTRITIKVNEKIKLPDQLDLDLGKYLESHKIMSWRKVNQLAPGVKVNRLFRTLKPGEMKGLNERARENYPKLKQPYLYNYLVLDLAASSHARPLLNYLNGLNTLQYSYVNPRRIKPPSVQFANEPLFPQQLHLAPAPVGVDAVQAWKTAGGDGSGPVQLIDIEVGWLLNHEDLLSNNGTPDVQLLSGKNKYSRGHGTAVLGTIMARDNSIGVLGVVPAASCKVISTIRDDDDEAGNVPDAIVDAYKSLKEGDVLLIEQHSARFTFYSPVEVEPAVSEALDMGAALNIVIIEAAGNGGQDLDQLVIDGKNSLNRLNTDFHDTGTIIVGASDGTAAHARSDSSNFGSRIDCFAWGKNITTTGSKINKYTSRFGGTSGASAIIAGVALAIQSMVKTAGRPVFKPSELRKILSNRALGTPSEKPLDDKIGSMPDLQKIIKHLGL